MTYQQKFEELRRQFHEKGELLIRAEKALDSVLGWGDSRELSDFLNAKAAFDEAAGVYHDFISTVQGNKIEPSREYVP